MIDSEPCVPKTASASGQAHRASITSPQAGHERRPRGIREATERHGLQIGRVSEKRWRRLSGYRRLGDVLEFKPFKNGLPVQPEPAQDALAA